MNTPAFVIASLALLAASNLAAAPAPAADAATPAPARPTTNTSTSTSTSTNADRRIEEDDQVRIEETRARGETQRIVVKPKTAGAKEYQIVPATGAVDPSQRHQRGTGERVWRLFSF